MTNYAETSNSCRVDFFKPSGKWYATEAVLFSEKKWSKANCIYSVFEEALKICIGNRYSGMTAVCLHPYHELEHPLSIILSEKE